jgi:hypothetical protein
MQFSIDPRFREVLELNWTSRVQRIKMWIVIGVGAFMLCCAGWLHFVDAEPEKAAEIWPWGIVFALIGLSAPLLAAAGAWIWQGARKSYAVELDEEKIRLTWGEETADLGWELVERYYETQNLVVLVLSRWIDAVSIPKRVTTQEQLTDLLELLKKKTVPDLQPREGTPP